MRISPAASALHLANSYERVLKVQIVLNGSDEYDLELPSDGVTSAILRFEKPVRVRQVEIRLPARSADGKQRAGLSEVSLIGQPTRKRRSPSPP